MAIPLKEYLPVPDDMLVVEWTCPECMTSWYTKPGKERPDCECGNGSCSYASTRVNVERYKLHLQDREQRLQKRRKGT